MVLAGVYVTRLCWVQVLPKDGEDLAPPEPFTKQPHLVVDGEESPGFPGTRVAALEQPMEPAAAPKAGAATTTARLPLHNPDKP